MPLERGALRTCGCAKAWTRQDEQVQRTPQRRGGQTVISETMKVMHRTTAMQATSVEKRRRAS